MMYSGKLHEDASFKTAQQCRLPVINEGMTTKHWQSVALPAVVERSLRKNDSVAVSKHPYLFLVDTQLRCNV